MSAAIYSKEANINYLRYCQEYAAAWIEFMPEIVKAVEKFDGKKVTKRIDTAIKKVDDRLSFTIEKDGYGNGGYVYLKWFDYDGRIFTDEETGQWDYVKHANGCDFIIMFRVKDMDCFDAKQFAEKLENEAENQTRGKDHAFNALDHLDELKEEYNRAAATFMEVQSKIPSYVLDHFNRQHHHIGQWR